MKRYFFSLLAILSSVVAFSAQSAFAFDGCNQNFYFDVRYQHAYRFYDQFNNDSGRTIYLNTYNIDYENPYYLDMGSQFGWSSGIRSRNFALSAGTSGFEVLNSGSRGWIIANHPVARSSWYDFGIRYRVAYDFSNNYPDASDDNTHSECAYYRITWCWDGVRDTGYNESCDPADPSHSGWGNGGCNASCQPVTVQTSCQNGGVARPSSSPVTLSSWGLCPMGQTVANFNANTSGNTTNYSWSCNGNSGGDCNTSYTNNPPPPSSSCQNGGVGGAQSAPISASTPGLCSAGAVGNFVSSVNGTTTNYSWSCGGLTGGNCSASYAPGWTGGGYLCATAAITSSNGNSRTIQCTPTAVGVSHTFRVDCGNGTVVTADASDRATCTYTDTSHSYNAQCLMNAQTVADPNCSVSVPFSPGGGGGGGGGGSGNYCGDGTVQRPNNSGFMEECDAGSRNGQPGVSCGTNCLMWGGGGGGISTQPSGEFQRIWTNPRSNPMSLSEYSVIVGDNTSVFRAGQNLNLYVDYPVYIGGLLSEVKSESSYVKGDTVSKRIPVRTCAGKGNMVIKEGDISKTIPCSENYQLFSYNEISGFKGSTSTIDCAAQKYGDTADKFNVNVKWLSGPINVRVSCPIVSNTAGGNAYLSRAAGSGNNVNELVNTFLDNLKKGNFTTAAMVANADGSSASWSATRDVNGAAGGNTQTGSIQAFSQVEDTARHDVTINNAVELESLPALGDNTNVRVLANGNVSIESAITISGVKTILVKNGDLKIDANITYADADSSVAFVVENGNIIIGADVNKISGAFVAMNGELSGAKTSSQLAVDGNIYGKAQKLVAARTYVWGDSESSALTTGVTINYSARALKNPPPLLTEFLDQYSLSKVSK